MSPNELVPRERLFEEEYGKVLCYPEHDLKELKRRVKELKKLGVSAVEFTGDKKAFDMPVLGKGCVGIVIAAHTKRGKVALKIRRVDADRTEMRREAQMQRKANTVGVGPCLLNVADDFLLMEFVDGKLLPQWIEDLEEMEAKSRIRRALRALLEQCWTLDEAGLDHGQLSRAPKHIIIDEKGNPYIVDFETASISRRVSNVTSICQYLFIGSQTANEIRNKLGEVDRTRLIDTLKNYKKQRARDNFLRILCVCGLNKI